MAGVPEEKRSALVAKMLNTPLPAQGARDLSLDEHGPGIGYPADEDPVRQIAASALAGHLSWVETNPDILRWLLDHALLPIPREHPPAETWSLLGPAFERAVDFHLSSVPGASPEVARSVLRAWMASIRATLADAPPSHIYIGEVVQRRIHALGDRGRAAGITPEVKALLDELPARRDAVIASFLLDLP